MKKSNVTLLAFAMILTIPCGLAACGSSASKSAEEQTEALPAPSKSDTIRAEGYVVDTFTTSNGRNIDIAFIKHGSLMLDIDNYLIYIDPVTMFGNDFTKLPKADMIFVTHEHHDHYDTAAIARISDPATRMVMSRQVANMHGTGDAILPGESIDIENGDKTFTLTAVPAYNNTEGHLQFHPRERLDVGAVFDVDGLRVYVAGDTEDIPEMAELKDIDIAFLPVNQPYTMTPDQAANAIEMLLSARSEAPGGKLIVYPYHYGDTDLTPLITRYQDSPRVELRIRDMQ